MSYEKKFIGIFVSVLLALTFALSACSDNGNGTYYPTNDEMKANLEKNGYTVTLYQDISGNDGKHYDGTLIFSGHAREGEQEEYIYFYRLADSSSCDYFYNSMEEHCKNYNFLVKIENDEKFGNIVYCGTAAAVDAAGIRVVDVKVDVKV